MVSGPDDPGWSGPDEAADRPPRTVSKAGYFSLWITLCVVFQFVELASSSAISRSLGVRHDSSWAAGLGYLNVVLAKVAADRILKRMGLSRSGKTVERRGRAAPLTCEDDDDEVVVVDLSPSTRKKLGVLGLIACLLIVPGMAAVTQGVFPDLRWTLPLLAFLEFIFAYGCYDCWWGQPRCRADRFGIMGYPTGPTVRRRFVPWSDVAICEIVARYDTFGKRMAVWPVLKGRDGKTLLALDLQLISLEDQERLVKYIRTKLPKPKDELDDFWE